MPEFMMLMKGSAVDGSHGWDEYIQTVQASGRFRGGSSLGDGTALSKSGPRKPVVTGFMRFEADTIDEVRALLTGNPVYDGGEVEIHELVPEE